MMRIIYRSPRLQNAEQIAALLEAQGVATRLIFGPHHRRSTWRGVDYNNPGDDRSDWPGVMVINNGDLPKARAILRDTGLIEPAAFARGEEAPDIDAAWRPASLADEPAAPRRRNWPAIIRTILVLIVLVLAALHTARFLF